jgi:tRNA G18 (ribose-2'-O)-methylase SpoU
VLIPLTNLDAAQDPRLADYANLTDAQLRSRDFQGERSVFIAEGELVVRKLLSSRFPVRSLLLTPLGHERLGDALAGLPDETPIFVAEPPLLERIVGFPFHRGILACGERLPSPPLADLLRSRVLVIAEDMANTDNIGSIFRNLGCLAGRGAGVLLSPGCCDPLYRKSLRVSIGFALEVPFGSLEPWPDALEQVVAAGFQVLAMTPDPAATALSDLSLTFSERFAVLLGAEGPGLSSGAFGRASRKVRIPMAQGADSLNVATAAAVVLSRLVNPQ